MPLPAAGIVAAATFGVVAAGVFAAPGFASDASAPTLPQPGDTTAVLAPLTPQPDASATQSGLQQALSGPLSVKALGPNARVAVFDTDTGNLLYDRSASNPAIPASTNKLLTSAAVLNAYGADYRIKTSVVQGSSPTDLILVGGGDPLLRTTNPGPDDTPAASLSDLADQTASALKAAASGGGETPTTLTATVNFNDSLFSGPKTAPSWPSSYVASNLVSPITALMINGGGGADPAKTAATTFASLLKKRGISVSATPARVTAGSGGTEVAAVNSPALSGVVTHTLTTSDNTAAEMLAHLAGVKNGTGGSFEGGTVAVSRTLEELGISTQGVRLYDGSGLSRDNQVPAQTIGQVLNKSAISNSQQLWPIPYGMPIAGFTGTLANRFILPATKPGRGEARAKTGTLTSVSSLAGIVTDDSGQLLTFVFMAPAAVDVLGAQVAWDRATAALAQCGCK
ncbi:MAG TPA: D-alanyl-D-alanine carboxypeptidase/D-alanyl-D-alanine-endopeptidase [Actinobacteria bacterium]|jgi:D-alanyl-D-alanine carboxypeptidase/D-alanyl-D-alanine-endopeptidase (penicillin-binding protein 4)|nr:D-alanyl-D-alanine carboxypeptidase/D-alanyl-D-alanine-endopeptidase [Actinomycetota bacterium]